MNSDIFKRIEQSKSPDFGGIISKSFDLFKEVWVEALMHALMSILIVIPFIVIIYAPIIPIYADMFSHMGDPYYRPENYFEQYSAGAIIGWYLLILVVSFLMQPFALSINGHFMQHCKKVDTGSSEEIGGYFTLLKKHFGKMFLLSLAITGITVLAVLLCYLPIFYVLVPISLTTPIFIFNQDLSVSQIINAAFKLGNKFWGLFFGLILVAGLIASLGMVFCFIGILVTSYYQYIILYYMYKDTVGFEASEDAV